MITLFRHTAGFAETLTHSVSLSFMQTGYTETQFDLVSRFIEFWCQKNCIGDWRVEETNKYLTVSFDKSRDFILFKLSEESEYFLKNKLLAN